MNEVIQRILQEIDFNREYSANTIHKDDYELEAKLVADEINYCNSSKEVEQVMERIFQRKYGEEFTCKHPVRSKTAEKIFTLVE